MSNSMRWKKLLDTKDLIAYEKKNTELKVRIEARHKKNAWSVYKTYNFLDGDEWVSHVREYITRSKEETKDLLQELRKEQDITLRTLGRFDRLNMELTRCYKEDFVEKWRFKFDDFNTDNFVIIRYDSETRMDIVMHDRYNDIEKDIFNKLVESLGLQGISNKIRYEIFYFRKHSSKRRTYVKKEDSDIIAKLEFNLDNFQG